MMMVDGMRMHHPVALVIREALAQGDELSNRSGNPIIAVANNRVAPKGRRIWSDGSEIVQPIIRKIRTSDKVLWILSPLANA